MMLVKIKTIRKQLLVIATIMMSALLTSVDVLALTVSSMTPASGSLSGGGVVTIKGQGFTTEENEQFIDVAAGVEHAVLLSSNGHVWVLGRNEYGQLGAGKSSSVAVVTPVDITDGFNLDSDDYIIGVYSGDYHSFAVSNNHRVFGWGKNSYGQIGDGTKLNRNTPVDITDKLPLSAGDFIVAIAGGVETSFALTNNGETLVWGDSRDYQDGQTNERFAPRTTPELATAWMNRDVRQLSVGNRSAISLNANGTVMTWGNNKSGELGRTKDDDSNRISPRESMYPITDNFNLQDGDVIVDIEAGNGVMAALTKYHQVYIWGNDQTGMLGLGGEVANVNDQANGNDFSSTPLNITDKFNIPSEDCISQISIGNSHVLALTQYGQVLSWGEGDYGQLGNAAMMGSNSPINITDQFNLPDGTTIDKVLAGGAADPLVASYSYAIDSDGNVYAWGGSAKGLPGINAITNTASPAKISDRLTVDVANVASVEFGDQPAEEIDVLGDETLQAVVPAGLTTGEVAVVVVDKSGNAVPLMQKYTYIKQADSSLDEITGSDGDDVSDKTDDAPGQADGNSDDRGNDETGDQDSSGGDSNDEKSANQDAANTVIVAPNTGAMVGLVNGNACAKL